MTSKEIRQIREKGKRWLVKYLNGITEGALSEESCSEFVKAVCRIYSNKMKCDESFSENVISFCSEKRTAEEKEVFFFNMLMDFVKNRSNKGLKTHRDEGDGNGGESMAAGAV